MRISFKETSCTAERESSGIMAVQKISRGCNAGRKAEARLATAEPQKRRLLRGICRGVTIFGPRIIRRCLSLGIMRCLKSRPLFHSLAAEDFLDTNGIPCTLRLVRIPSKAVQSPALQKSSFQMATWVARGCLNFARDAGLISADRNHILLPPHSAHSLVS